MRKLILLGLLCYGTAHAAGNTVEEKILGYQPRKSGIIFQVKSGGCTQAEDFVTEAKKSDSGVMEIKLIRIRPDNCHPFLPMGFRFQISYENIGITAGERYTITNLNGVVYGSVWE